jgi:hypothetical protein
MNAAMKKSSFGARLRLGGAVLILAAAFSLGTAGIAFGAKPLPTCKGTSSASHQYCTPKTVVAGTSAGSASGGNSAPPSNTGGTLPFTGMSLIWPAIGAIALVSLGLGLRRYERKNS